MLEDICGEIGCDNKAIIICAQTGKRLSGWSGDSLHSVIIYRYNPIESNEIPYTGKASSFYW